MAKMDGRSGAKGKGKNPGTVGTDGTTTKPKKDRSIRTKTKGIPKDESVGRNGLSDVSLDTTPKESDAASIGEESGAKAERVLEESKKMHEELARLGSSPATATPPPGNGPAVVTPQTHTNMKQLALSYFQARPQWQPMVNKVLFQLDEEGIKALIALFSLIQDDARKSVMTGRPQVGPTVPGVLR